MSPDSGELRDNGAALVRVGAMGHHWSMPTEPTAAPPRPPLDWPTLGRIVLKALLLFTLLNAAFAAARPLEALGRLSLYNLSLIHILSVRLRTTLRACPKPYFP